MLNLYPNVLLTGASGFVGQNIFYELRKSNFHITIHENKTKVDANIKRLSDSVVFGDLQYSDTWKNVMQGIDVIIHCAAVTPDSGKQKITPSGYEINTNMVKALALALDSEKKVFRKLIYISTANLYKFINDKAHEDDPVEPSRELEYFNSKMESERILAIEEKLDKIDLTIFRISTPFGPGELQTKVIPSFLLKIARNESIRILNGGTAKFNFVYVKEVGKFVNLSINQGKSGVYNLGGESSISILDLAKKIKSMFPKSSAKIEFIKSSNTDEKGFMPIDISRLQETFSLKPQSLDLGLIEYSKHLQLAAEL